MVHEALPATDGSLGRQRKMDTQGMVSLVLFVAFLVFFAGLLTGVIDGKGIFSLVRDSISLLGGVIGKLLG